MDRHAQSNGFDLLRLLAALAVIVEHSWRLTGHPSTPAGTGTDFGQVGVGVFFLASGFLISTSWTADPSLRRFALRRALRIYPAYAVVLLATVFLAGPLLTVLGPGAYFADPQTWAYLVRNLLVVPVDYVLPGVFDANPVPAAVNGSLWTIRVEVFCYLLVAVAGLLGLLRRRLVLVAAAVLLLAFSASLTAVGYHGALVPGALASTAAEPLAYFAIGVLGRAVYPRSRLPWWTAPVAVAAWAAAWHTPLANPLSVVAVTCVVAVVAFHTPSRLQHPTGRWDLSYGIYLIAFPVQQWLAATGLRNPWATMGATVGIVVPLAALSWLLVERRALRHKPSRPAVAPRPEEPLRPAPEAGGYGGGTGVPSS